MCKYFQTLSQQQSYTVDLLVGLNTKFSRTLHGASNEEYINFFRQVLDSFDDDGPPILQAGDIIVVDNLSCHHYEGERELRPLLTQYGIQYTFTPKYSPYFNPCEEVFGTM